MWCMTIHLRLTLIFTVLVAVLLGIFSFLQVATASYNRVNDFYELLKIRALTAADVVLEEDENDTKSQDLARRRLRNRRLQFEHIYIADSTHTLLYRSDTLNPRFSKDIATNVLSSKKLQNVSVLDTQFVYVPYEDGGKNYIIVASAYDVVGLTHVQSLKTTSFIMVIFAPLVVFAVGWIFTRRSILAPIEALANQAEKITFSVGENSTSVHLDEGNGKDEFAHLAKVFNRVFDRLDSTYRSQKQFVAHASHEMRTPLTIIEGHVEVALMSERTVEYYQKLLDSVLSDVRGLRHLANNLLLLTRTENALHQPLSDEVFLDEILYSVAETALERFPKRKIEIRLLPTPETEFIILGKSELLHVAFLNLVENALKYSSPESTVWITCMRESSMIKIVVKDEGIGIQEKEVNQIFEPFFRAENSAGIAGSGIGLTLVKAIFHRHHAQIYCVSTIGKGTEMCVIVPR